jgi:hypothetical protein
MVLLNWQLLCIRERVSFQCHTLFLFYYPQLTFVGSSTEIKLRTASVKWRGKLIFQAVVRHCLWYSIKIYCTTRYFELYAFYKGLLVLPRRIKINKTREAQTICLRGPWKPVICLCEDLSIWQIQTGVGSLSLDWKTSETQWHWLIAFFRWFFSGGQLHYSYVKTETFATMDSIDQLNHFLDTEKPLQPSAIHLSTT